GRTCIMGTCEDCGQTGQPCCEGAPGIPCLPNNVCSPTSDTCVHCGQAGEFCCPGNFCTSPSQCDGTMCSTCGGVSQPACTPTPTSTPTATRTPTATPSATPTNTPKPNGAECAT